MYLLVVVNNPLIPRHGIQQPTSARHAPVCAIDEAHRESEGQDRRGGAVPGRLEDELGDRHVRRRLQHGLGIRDAEQDHQDEDKAAESPD